MAASLWGNVTDWSNLLIAWRRAAGGKRGKGAAAGFEHRLADKLLVLQAELLDQSYQPGDYRHFYIHEPKRRKISAAPFRDRVVHHAVCNVIEPIFEQRFHPHSYANRIHRGTHRAVDRLQTLASRKRYVLRADVVKHFPALDHAILLAELERVIPDEAVMWLARKILAGGDAADDTGQAPSWFPGDDLLGPLRPRGLPIGNLTSQFWSNVYMNPFDWFVQRELGCGAYLRYVDDFALFSDSKQELRRWHQEMVQRLARLRLTLHQPPLIHPVTEGIPWLGFIVYPTHRRVKRRNVVQFRRRIGLRMDDYAAGRISFAELDASVKGWINHIRYADTWGLRRHMFRSLPPIGRPKLKPRA